MGLLDGIFGKIIKSVGAGGAGLLGGGTNTTTGNSSTQSSNVNESNEASQASFQNWLQNFLSQETNTSGGTSNVSTTTPNIAPGTQKLIDYLTQRYTNLSSPSLTSYGNQQAQVINKNADIQRQAVDQILASRGLSMSPAAATALSNVDAQRFSNLNQMRAQLPLIQADQDRTNLAAASNFMQMVPHSTTTTGGTANTQSTSQNQSQNQTSGGQNFSNNWGYGTNQGTSNTQSTQTQKQGGSIAGGIAGILAGLFSDERLKEDIKPIDKALDKIVALRPSRWKWKGSEVEDSGIIAQDVAKVMPELIDGKDESGYLKVNYAGLIGTLVGAVKELKEEMN